MSKEMVCIVCPIGCRMKVTIQDSEITVTGNTCKRGEVYAKKECTSPTRFVTSTMKVNNGERKLVSVKTDKDIPKDKIMECMNCINSIEVEAPITMNQVLIPNLLELDINVISTSTVKRK